MQIDVEFKIELRVLTYMMKDFCRFDIKSVTLMDFRLIQMSPLVAAAAAAATTTGNIITNSSSSSSCPTGSTNNAQHSTPPPPPLHATLINNNNNNNNRGWSASCLRPSPPLRPCLALGLAVNNYSSPSSSPSSCSGRKPTSYREDALILDVIEAYCCAAKPRNTVNSGMFPLY